MRQKLHIFFIYFMHLTVQDQSLTDGRKTSANESTAVAPAESLGNNTPENHKPQKTKKQSLNYQ